MALTDDAAIERATALWAEHRQTLHRNGSKGRVARYLAGDHDLPYAPREAGSEFRRLARRSITSWLPLISDTFAKSLFVDGYRPAKAADNARPWDFWQANGLDARQAVAHRGALEYGTSHTLVLPGDPVPVIRPLSPLRTHALYADPDDDFPAIGLVTDGKAADGSSLMRLLDDEAVYSLRLPKGGGALQVVDVEEHGLNVVPLVRFRERLDGDAVGIIAPLIPLQDRVNETVFALMVALQYASFRQRWATGLAIPVDRQETLPDGSPNPNFGNPIETFEAAIDRLWTTDSPDAKFGDFAQTDVSGHLRAYESTVRSLAAIAQTPPNALLGDLVNLSAEALAAAEASTQRKGQEYETLFGESWEQVLRLAAAADGDAENAEDTSASVRWRDTEARSLASTVDALGKMVQMLSVPAEAAWERIPGVTDADVERWRTMRQETDVLGAMLGDLTRQTAANPATAVADAPAAPAVPAPQTTL